MEVLATAGTYDSLITTLTSSASEVASAAMTSIASILPVALTVVGATVVVTIGLKVFKRVVSK